MTEPAAIICLTGPTGTGKSEHALRLAEQLNAEIISVDSVLVYRGLDIGTAKPSSAMRDRAPHHLIDLCDPSEIYSAARFQQDALGAIESIRARGKLPLLVGGTMMYFRALQQGLSPLPSADSTVRQRLQEERYTLGISELFKRLQRIDPKTAERVSATDWQRIQRALEVFEITGCPLSQILAEQPGQPASYQFQNLALVPEDRQALYKRLAERFDAMLRQGLIEEVEALYQRGDLNAALPAIRAVGYRQVWDYLHGRLDYQAMRAQAAQATQQLAKRQLTWLRHWPRIQLFDYEAFDLERRLADAMSLLI